MTLVRAAALGAVLAARLAAEGQPITGDLDLLGPGAAPARPATTQPSPAPPGPSGSPFRPMRMPEALRRLSSGGGERPADAAPIPPGSSRFAPELLLLDAAPRPTTAPASPPEPTSFDTSDPVRVRLEVPPRPPGGGRVTLVLTLAIEGGFHLYGPSEKLGAATEVEPIPVPGIRWGAPVFPPTKSKDVPVLGGKLQLFEGLVRVELPAEMAAAGAVGPIRLRLRYQPCTDQVCLMARERVVGAALGETFADPGIEDAGGFLGVLADYGVLGALLLAYLWGLAASLSPCVYPMIPVTIAYFGGQGESPSRLRTLLLALAYVAGIALTYAALGVAFAKAGRDLGSVLVHPVAVTLVAGLLFAMGLSLYGVFEMSLPQSLQDRLTAGEHKGIAGALFTGAVLGLVAAPCVGPFATSILVFVAKSGSVVLGFCALASFGLGLGTLFLVLALGVSSLPRSGVWLIATKKVFGWVLFGSALWFLAPLLPAAIRLPLWGAYLTLGGVLGGALEPAEDSGERAARAAALLALVGGLYLFVAGPSGSFPMAHLGKALDARPGPAASLGPAWAPDLKSALAAAARSGKPVFADFYADWCIPCKTMDAGVFPEPRVMAELAAFELAKIDCTQPGSEGARLKNRELGIPAMPYLAVFEAGGRHRPDLSHQGYLEVEEFLALLTRARAALAS